MDWHKNAELSFEETYTSALIVDRLTKLGLTPTLGLGQAPPEFKGAGQNYTRGPGTGVTALIQGGSPGPCIALRADMDALPIKEVSDLDYCSVTSAMHACGHDGHGKSSFRVMLESE